MSDILFVCINGEKEYLRKLSGAWENLGILYLEASLKHAGYTCSIIDSMAYSLSYERILKEILENPPAIFIGFSLLIKNTDTTISMIRDLKKYGFKGHITIGGMWGSFKYREILKQVKEVDSVAVGEGEELVVSLAGCISKGKNFSDIKGLATRGDGNSIVFTPGRLQDNIDTFPVPDRRGYYFDAIKKEYITILFSRGCHMGCSFCSSYAYIKLCGGKKWRPRNPENVVDEMEYIVDTTGIDYFFFADDNFLGPAGERERCFSLAEEIIKRKLRVKFIMTCRVEGVEYELFRKLKQAGLIRVDLGVESWVDEQLKRYNKGATIKENLRALKILDELNIVYHSFLIPLDPYVTREEIRQNLDMMEKIGLEHILTDNFCTKIELNQYQPLFKRCLKDNLIRNFCPDDIDNDDIEYVQFHSDVNGIVDAHYAISEIYFECLSKSVSGIKKLLPDRTGLESKINQALQRSLYKYFREYVDSEETEGGYEFIYSKMAHVYENICSFTEKISRRDMPELKDYTLDIDGISISLKPEGLDDIISDLLDLSLLFPAISEAHYRKEGK